MAKPKPGKPHNAPYAPGNYRHFGPHKGSMLQDYPGTYTLDYFAGPDAESAARLFAQSAGHFLLEVFPGCWRVHYREGASSCPALIARDRAEQTAAEQALAADPAGRPARNVVRRTHEPIDPHRYIDEAGEVILPGEAGYGEHENIVARQEWRTFDGMGFIFGNQLARRLVQKRLRDNLLDTLIELAQCSIGQCVNAGVSSWERTA